MARYLKLFAWIALATLGVLGVVRLRDWTVDGNVSATPDGVIEVLYREGADSALRSAESFRRSVTRRTGSHSLAVAEQLEELVLALATDDSFPEDRLSDLLPIANQAVAIVEKADSTSAAAHSVFLSAGALHHYVGDFARAVEIESRGLRYLELVPDVDPVEVAVAKQSLAMTLIETDQRDRAIELAVDAYEELSGSDEDHSVALVDLANLIAIHHSESGEHEVAAPWYEVSLRTYNSFADTVSTRDPDRLREIRDQRNSLRINLAAVYQAQAKREHARTQLNLVLGSGSESDCSTEHRARALIALAFIDQRQSLLDRAEARLRGLIEALGADGSADAILVADAHLAYTSQLLDAGRFQEALDEAGVAVEMYRCAEGRARVGYPLALLRMVQASRRLEDSGATARYVQSALEEQEKLSGPESAEVGVVLSEKALWLESRGDSPQAALVAQDALDRLGPSGLYPRYAIEARACLARVHWGRGHRDAAIAEMNAVIAEIERVRYDTSSVTLERSGTFGQFVQHYHQLARWYLDTGTPDAMWRVAERSKARGFQTRNRSSEPVAFEAPTLASLAEVQAWLAERNAVALSYLAGQESLGLVVVSPREVQFFSLDPVLQVPPLSSEFDSESARVWERTARQLIPEAVLEQIRDAESVLIAPDGIVSSISFAALVLRAGGDAADTVFWIDELPWIQYAPSVSLLVRTALSSPTPSLTRAATLVAVSRPPIERIPLLESMGSAAAQWGGLPFARAEVRDIAASLDDFRVATLVDGAATEDRVLASLGQPGIVHLATHGVVRSLPDEDVGGLLLYPGSSGSDGFLEMREIRTASLGCDLVVLSACDSYTGRILAGEGVLALGRAFLESGATSVVGTLWSVQDRSTSQLMSGFYDRLKSSESISVPWVARSLWGSQKAMRAQEQSSSPRHWASFVLVGS